MESLIVYPRNFWVSAGKSSSKNIIAINKNPEANIFGIAHYGVVGDYEKIFPAFVEKCKELTSG